MKKILITVACIILIGMVFVGCEAESKKIVIATDATWPPMEYVDENKEIVGFDIDLMNLAAKEGGFKVEFQNTAWDGIFTGLASGEYDAVMSSVTITEERQETMDFSIAYINAGQVLIVRQSTKNVTTLSDMAGMEVGAQIGTTGSFEVEKVQGVVLRTYDELGMAIEDLANGGIDGVVADTPIAADYVLQNDKYKSILMIVGEPFTDELYGVAVKKGNDEILDQINAGLQQVLGTDEYTELEDKWLR